MTDVAAALRQQAITLRAAALRCEQLADDVEAGRDAGVNHVGSLEGKLRDILQERPSATESELANLTETTRAEVRAQMRTWVVQGKVGSLSVGRGDRAYSWIWPLENGPQPTHKPRSEERPARQTEGSEPVPYVTPELRDRSNRLRQKHRTERGGKVKQGGKR